MLRITVNDAGPATRFLVEGKLAGPWVGELRKCWESSGRIPPRHAIIDLTGVTFIDPSGKALLFEMHRQGVRFVAAGLMTQAIVDEIRASKQ